jgi:predicted dehydrogenase
VTPGGTWHTDPAAGGGRVIGEICHFVDLCTYLVGASPISVYAHALGRDPRTDDSISALFTFPDGSTATLQYLAHTSAALPKERFEVSCDGKTANCDNFKKTRVLGGRSLRTWNQDKGQATAVHEVIEAVRSGAPSPFTWAEIAATTRATFAMLESVRTGNPVRLDGPQ